MKTILILICFTTIIFAQDNELDPNIPISGVINSIDGIYLIYDHGFIQLDQNDTYEEYYRKIYNDSTIVNPNTIIQGNYNLSFIPYLNFQNKQYEEYTLDEPLKFGHLIQINPHGSYKITEFGHHILDSLKTLKD